MPYMIINLKYDWDIYIGKDTIMAYAWEEDKTCEYLEVNEVIESTEFRNWTPRKGKSIIDSNLVFSPAQVKEHYHVELKEDQEVSQETKDRFEKLKTSILRYFQSAAKILDIQTWLLCMLTREIVLPFVKSHILCLLSITAGFSRRLRH